MSDKPVSQLEESARAIHEAKALFDGAVSEEAKAAKAFDEAAALYQQARDMHLYTKDVVETYRNNVIRLLQSNMNISEAASEVVSMHRA